MTITHPDWLTTIHDALRAGQLPAEPLILRWEAPHGGRVCALVGYSPVPQRATAAFLRSHGGRWAALWEGHRSRALLHAQRLRGGRDGYRGFQIATVRQGPQVVVYARYQPVTAVDLYAGGEL